MEYRKLDVPGFADFDGAGIYYAATEMEAKLCQGQEVVVVGAGNSAGQAIVFLARYGGHGGELRARTHRAARLGPGCSTLRRAGAPAGSLLSRDQTG